MVSTVSRLSRPLPALALAIACGCGPLDGQGAGDWPSRTVAFLGDGDDEDRIGLASAAAEGVVWPEAIPDGEVPIETRWAATGGTLVTRTDAALYAWDVAGDERRHLGAVPFGDSALVGPSPDGMRIGLDVFTDVGGPRRRVSMLDVATGEELGAAVGCEIERFVWATTTPEAFAVERHCAMGSATAQERAVVRVGGGTSTVLVTSEPAIEIDIAASPDGRWLALAATDAVTLLDLAGGEPVELEAGQRPRIAPSWSSDGAWLSWVDLAVGEVVVIGSDGSGRRTLTPASTWAQFDPLGDLLVVQRPCGGGAELVGLDPATGEEHVVLACDALEEPAWSPDGAALVVRSPCDADAERVVFASADGSRLGSTECERFGALRWSPDGDAIATTWADENAPLGVAVVRRDGSLRRLADGHEPAWRG
jgi:hypothetical protein